MRNLEKPTTTYEGMITCPWCGGVTRPVLKENGKYECDRCKRETSE
tara:strand:- start:732 stop:869 length:138 start_codon:yes stop_codon:yes gene_type:complete